MLQLTANLETLIHRTSEQADFARLDNSVSPMNLVWMETVPLPFAESTQSQRIVDIQDYKQASTIP